VALLELTQWHDITQCTCTSTPSAGTNVCVVFLFTVLFINFVYKKL